MRITAYGFAALILATLLLINKDPPTPGFAPHMFWSTLACLIALGLIAALLDIAAAIRARKEQ